jgi:predicted adenine nucleotide alpha hydrolase (AANH) superfamily ATPase
MSGSAFLMRVLWYARTAPTIGVDITNFIELSPTKAVDIQNNILNFTLKNYDGRFLNADGTLKFKQGEKFELYAKLTEDLNDLVTTTWQDDNALVGVYFLQEFSHEISDGTFRFKIKCLDQLYVLFNRVMTQTYGIASSFTAPGIFRAICRANSDLDAGQFYGTDNVSGVRFSIQSNWLSEGGFIQDYRLVSEGGPSTTLNGSLSAGGATITVTSTAGFKDAGTLVIGSEHIAYTAKNATQFTGCTRGIDDGTDVAHADGSAVYQGFPLMSLNQIWKPIYEWLSTLSQTININYPDETVYTGSVFYPRAFLMNLNHNNKMEWYNPDDSVDHSLVIGQNDIYNLSITRTVLDAINFVIYNAGEDMNGVGITWYFYNSNTNISEFKMRYQPMTDIADTYLKADTNPKAATPADNSLRKYPAAYPVSDWSFKIDSNKWRAQNGETARTTLTNNTDWNDSLREACKWNGLQRAIQLTLKMSGLRYKGTIAMRFNNMRPGDLISLTSVNTEMTNKLVRVIDVRHSINARSITTNLEVEEDDKTILSNLIGNFGV